MEPVEIPLSGHDLRAEFIDCLAAELEQIITEEFCEGVDKLLARMWVSGIKLTDHGEPAIRRRRTQ